MGADSAEAYLLSKYCGKILNTENETEAHISFLVFGIIDNSFGITDNSFF